MELTTAHMGSSKLAGCSVTAPFRSKHQEAVLACRNATNAANAADLWRWLM